MAAQQTVREEIPPRPLSSLTRDPVLLGLVALTVVGCVLFQVFPDDLARRTQIYWAVQVPMDGALAVGAWRLRHLAPARYRRFWSFIAFAGASFTLGDTFQFGSSLVDPEHTTTGGGLVQNVLFVIGMSANVLACLMFPQGLQTGRERLIFWLDSATVLVGGGVLAWCFAVNPIDQNTDRVAASLTVALVIVAAFAATKVALCPEPPMDRIAAWPMVAAPIVQGVSTFLLGAFGQQDRAYGFAVQLLPSLLIAVGPRIQEITVRIAGNEARRRRRPYSLLPYGMVAFTFVMFFLVLPQDVSIQLWGAIAGVVVITALVAGRQLIAFQDNTLLIGRLDVALDDLKGQDALLRWQASHDALTGLANRARFQQEATRLLGSTDTARSHTALLIDLDDFKTVNDTMGHAAGDTLLVSVADRLRAAVRPGDLVARLGGDEFAVLMPDADDVAARAVAENVLRHVTQDVDMLQHTVAVRASVGIAVARPGAAPSTLLSNADIAMYEAKRRGKDTWALFSSEMGLRINAEAEMIREMAAAADAGQFTLVYQPIVRLDDMTMTGVEALIRWYHPERGLISPVDFIPLAERSGHIVSIGRWALREATRQAAAWRARFPQAEHLTVGVNVAGRQLRSGQFVEEVAAVLAETGLPASCLSIEVTETAVLDDQESIDAMLRLRELGVKLALDDFGTAASSLGLLLTCPVTTLKLDRSFVESIITVGRQAAVATAVSQMANALDFSSVAEGIETEEQCGLLRELGYRYGQGYLFSRPVTADQLAGHWVLPAPGALAVSAG
ncbi:EAL domain-containing protein [Kineosporia sp. J2-2]|uniref:EAL domain-containing protein n=1 Tax=Kineosporia corallincola TaxID=2835133 RepID=A0ABS5TMF7_9ACTN|nr:EAL domain-containing protein [Kineosporia corallincola]MBT0771554.1 EAL domain-containing protein [Kineosporia corallincola]